MLTIEYIDETYDVYDITVDDNHNFFANDILVHNCQEITIPQKPYKDISQLYKAEYEEGDGEIGLCSLGGVIVSNIDDDEMYAEVAYYALKMVDVFIHKSDYVFPNLANTAKARLSAGVGIIGLAHLMAKNGMRYDTQDGKNFVHEIAETHMWHLINASLKLGQEKGNAPWMHKTKWPQGWLPIDTYEKRVDSLVTVENKRDWESLRTKIVANGGIRNSVVAAHMPGESSTIGAGTTNGLYPVRELAIVKTNDTLVNHWVAPDSTKLKDKYQRAWEISTKSMIEFYAIIQKWTDQGISADIYVDVTGDKKVSSSDIIDDYLNMVKYGMKTRYYVVSLTSSGVDLNKEATSAIDVEPPVQPATTNESAAYCESCAL